MKVLLYKWKAYSNRFLEQHLLDMGHEVKVWSNDAITRDSMEALPYLEQELKKGYDLVFSYNYFKILAIACHTYGMPYFAWTQDAPLLALYDSSTRFDTNYFFCFDYEQYEGLKKRGAYNAFYCPLGTDTKFMQHTASECTETEIEKYKAEISFVGSLYTERSMWSEMDGLPDFLKGYFNGIVEAQMRIPAIRFSQAQIPAEVMKKIRSIICFEDGEESCIRYEELIDNLVDRQVTVIERQRMLELLVEKSDFKLYTNSETSSYPKVNNCGGVDYYTEMPKVFRHSDININITLRSIRSGIPLRVLDVMAAGGFLLTNAQPELEFFFKEGESIATFHGLEEMEDKIEYYLSHEQERRRIIENAYKIVESQFDYKVRLPQIFEMAGMK